MPSTQHSLSNTCVELNHHNNFVRVGKDIHIVSFCIIGWIQTNEFLVILSNLIHFVHGLSGICEH